MTKYLLAAALIAGLSTPVFAVETFYVMFDNSMKGQPHACRIMTEKPSDAKYTLMGRYKTKAGAKNAMELMAKCK